MLHLARVRILALPPRLAREAVEEPDEDGAQHGAVNHVHGVRVLATEEQLAGGEQFAQRLAQADAEDDAVGGERVEALREVRSAREEDFAERSHRA